jgi:hypothetical protein
MTILGHLIFYFEGFLLDWENFNGKEKAKILKDGEKAKK